MSVVISLCFWNRSQTTPSTDIMVSRKKHKMSAKGYITSDLSNKKKKKISKLESKKLAKLIDKKLNLSDTSKTAKRSTSKSEKEKLAALFGAKVTLSSSKPETQVLLIISCTCNNK